MKKLKILSLILTGFSSLNLVQAQNNQGIDISLMDKTVRPQDDFYNYVNGNWMKTAKIPANRSTWGVNEKINEDIKNNLLEILNSILVENFKEGTEGKKIKDLYDSYINISKRNADGIKPIQPNLKQIDAIKNLNDLQNYLNSTTKKGKNTLYNWFLNPDFKDSKMNAVFLGSADLGLARGYYQKVNEKNTEILVEYQKYIASMLKELGYNNSDLVAKQIIDFEKQIANTYLTDEQINDITLQYNPKTMVELSTLVKNVNLPSYLKNVGINTDKVIIREINYYKNFDKFFNQKNLPLIKDYLKFHLINSNTARLTEDLYNKRFNFYNKFLRGQVEQTPLDKRGFELINLTLGEALGKLYVNKYFSAEDKAKMLELIDYLKKSFESRIKNLTWMSPKTKEKALEKLHKMSAKVAYPDTWKDYSDLKIVSDKNGGTLYENLQNVNEWQYKQNVAKVGKTVDKTEWQMTPQTLNFYYIKISNELIFPAAILQPPYFNPNADAAVNFGAIGIFIGHEISHGFDDTGAQFDADGNLIDWWTPEDKTNFEKATKALAAQYDKYEPVKGVFVNGIFTNNENISDLGGVNIAFDALQLYLKDHGNPGLIDGFTQNQRFFLSWASVNRTLMSEKFLIYILKTDEHAPEYIRSFAPLINVDAFYEAFDVKPGDKHYKKPEERIKIW